MKTRFLLYPAMMIAIIFSSCGSGYENEIDPVTRMLDSIAKDDSMRLWGPATAIDFDKEPDYQQLDLRRVSLEGYIGLSDSITQTESSTIIQLWSRKNQRAGNCYSIAVNMGSGTNTMDSLPENYAKQDLKVRDNAAIDVKPGDRVRITGIYHRPVNSAYGMIEVQVIEKLNDAPFDYPHSNALAISADLTPAIKENALVSADGYIIVPSSLHVTEFVPLKLIAERSSRDSISLNIPIGDGPNQIEDLPDNYGDDDVKIHDSGGKLTEYNKVRVYGVWRNHAMAVEYIEVR